MSQPLRVLFVEDSEDDTLALLRELRKAGFAPVYRLVETAKDLRAALEAQPWDLILSDFSMPRFDGLAAFELCRELQGDAPFILVSSRVGEERAVEAMRKGVKDYIVKDNLKRFIPAVRRELAELERRRESHKTERALAESEDKYRDLVEGSIQGMLIVQSGRVVYCNPSCAAMLGYGDPAELVGSPAIGIVHPDDRERALKTPVLDGGTPKLTVEFRGNHKDRAALWYEAYGRMTRWKGHRAAQWTLLDVTERRLAEEELRASQRLLRTVFDALPVHLVVKDTETRYLMVNKAWCERYGLTPDRVIGKRSIDLPGRPEADKRHTEEQDLKTLAATGDTIVFEGWDRTATGEMRHYQSVRAPIRDESGKVTGLVGATVDLTDQKRVEEKLRASESLLKTVFDTIPSFLVVKDRQSRYLMVNRAWEETYGVRMEDAVGKLPTDIAVREPGENARYVDEDRVVFEEGKTEEFRGQFIGADGSLRHYHSIKSPLRNVAGEITGLVALLVDMTGEVESRNKADLAHARLSDAIESLPAGFMLFDNQEKLVLWNSRMHSLFPDAYSLLREGTTYEQVARETAKQVAGTDPEAWASERLSKFREHPGRFEEQLRGGRWLEGYDVRTSDGGTVCLGFDMTEQKNREAQLRQAQKMEAVGHLTGGVAHHINNNLTVILASVEFLLDDIPSGDARRGDVTVIKDAAQRAASLTRQLLAFSRRQVLRLRHVDLNALVSDMGTLLHRLIGENIRVELRLVSGAAPLRADPAQLEQVLMNLAVNARDAMPEGGILTVETARVELDDAYASTHTETAAGPHLMLAVSDTGTGMDPATRERIFDPFFTTKPEGKGTGLGLATVYGIVKQMNGSIFVYSEPGKGTTFKIFFPILGEDQPAGPRGAAQAARARPEETVLLVEDDDLVRRSAQRILEGAGYRVLLASGPPQAIDVVHNHVGKIHLLLSDVVMRDGNGPDLWTRLKAERDIPALFMSGYTNDAVTRQGILEGELPYLEKPFTSQALLARVREVLDESTHPK